MDIEIKNKKGKDVGRKILTLALTLLSEFYDVRVNGERWSKIIKKK